MMKRIGYILMIAFLAALAGCSGLEEPGFAPGIAPKGEKVAVSFKVAIPDEGAATRAMGINPSIDPDGFYVAVFGGSGYFNEWVKADIENVSHANYDNTSATVYTLSTNLSVSDSRLRLHLIANCPASIRTSPPISGSQDTEEFVLSRIRSQKTEPYNDAYWQKVILPNGVRVNNVGTPQVPVYEATDATLRQFPDPIILVRNFARVYLRNLTPVVGETGNGHQLVAIKKFGLAYAPAEGVVAPILSGSYASNVTGSPIDTTGVSNVYYEGFLINYQRYPIDSNNPSDTLLTAAPFNYGGFSPADQSYDYYAAAGHSDRGVPLDSDLQTWDDQNPENNVLFVYERTAPSVNRRATRIIIKAERIDQNDVSEGDKYYALDIVNSNGVTIPILRNQTYTVHLLNIEAGSGETDVSKASTASSATVSGDPNYQGLVNISDGKSSIGTSFTEKFYVRPQKDSVMFRYIPTNITDENYEANREGNELVTIEVGSYDAEHGDFTPLTPSEASSAGILAFKTEGNNYKVSISKNGDDVIQYVRANNAWVPATSAQIDDITVEKWGMVKFELNESYKDSDDCFTEERTMAIQVTGSYADRSMSRIVVIKTSERQSLQVVCQQKFVPQRAGEDEIVRITIPTGLSRSVFPLEFTIEPDGYSLTPYGDVLPVAYGTSTIDGIDTPAFYYVKTITKMQYDALPVSGDYKYFDCHFKTTKAQNACTVYVKNRYFNDDNAYDEFYNFQQRLFSSLSLPNSVTRRDNVSFTFVMDYDHDGNTCVWWDPENVLEASANAAEAEAKGLSTTNRVFPPILTVTLIGFTPQYQADGETPVTSNLTHYSGNMYRYNVGSGTPTSDMASVTLALTASGAAGSTASVTLSTVNITENPELYAPNSISRTLQGTYSFSNLSFGTSPLPLGLNKTTTFSFRYAQGMVVPIKITLSGLTLDGSDVRMSANSDGTYTFTPTNENTRNYTISLKSTSRFSSCSVTLNQEDYTPGTLSLSRSTSFTIPANALYLRGIGSGNPVINIGTGNNKTQVYLSPTATTSTTNTVNSKYTNSYLNNSQQQVTLSYFDIVDDDAPVYFWYTYNNVNYYAVSSLSELSEATSSNRVTLHFRWIEIKTISGNGNYSTSNRTKTVDGVTVAFSALTNAGYQYVTANNGTSMTVSVTSGYHINEFDITYYSDYYSAYSGSITDGGGRFEVDNTAHAIWESGNDTTSSVTLRLTNTQSGYTNFRVNSVLVKVEPNN